MDQIERKAKGFPAGTPRRGAAEMGAVRGCVGHSNWGTSTTVSAEAHSLQLNAPRADWAWGDIPPLSTDGDSQKRDVGVQTEDLPAPQQFAVPLDAMNRIVPMASGLLGDVSGLDVFSMVDPAFPQDNVDFAFFSNLDPTCPSHEWPDVDPWVVDVQNAFGAVQ